MVLQGRILFVAVLLSVFVLSKAQSSTTSFLTTGTFIQANAFCSGAKVAVKGHNNFTNLFAPSNPYTCCSTAADAGIWYSYTPQYGGNLTLQTTWYTGTKSDNVMAVFSGSCGSLTEIACNDNSDLSLATISLLTHSYIGQTLYIQIGYSTAQSSQGNGQFILTHEVVNENCPGALSLDDGNNDFTTINSNFNPTAVDCASTTIVYDTWYKYTTTTSGTITITVESYTGTLEDTVLVVYTGPCYDLEVAGCNDDIDFDNGIIRSSTTFSVGASVQLYIRVGGYGYEDAVGGTGVLSITLV